MRNHAKRSRGSADLDASPRLTLKPHSGSVPTGAQRGYRVRLYAGDHVVGHMPLPNLLLMTMISAVLWVLICLAVYLLTSA